MEIREVKMKFPWEGREIIVSGIVLSVLCGLSHSISLENLWDMNYYDHFTGEEIKARDVDSLLSIIWWRSQVSNGGIWFKTELLAI